jgi:hypothetical protein
VGPTAGMNIAKKRKIVFSRLWMSQAVHFSRKLGLTITTQSAL